MPRLTRVSAFTLSVAALFAVSTTSQEPAVADTAVSEEAYVLVDRTADMADNTSRPRDADTTIDRVIVHFMSAVNVDADDPYNIDLCLKIFNDYGVSAHYVVGRDGTVYQAVADDRIAYHAGRPDPRFKNHPDFQNMNGRSIGIELMSVSTEADMTTGTAPMMSKQAYRSFAKKHPDWIGYTDAQYVALEGLMQDLRERHPAIQPDRKHILGHDEYAGPRKKDPGQLFDWSRVRE